MHCHIDMYMYIHVLYTYLCALSQTSVMDATDALVHSLETNERFN